MEHNCKQALQTQNTETNHIPQPRALLWLNRDLTLRRLSPMDVTAVCVLKTDRFKAENWEMGSSTSLSCRFQLHDRRSRIPETGIQSIAGSSVMIYGRHEVLSSTLGMCKTSKMGSLAPLKLGLGPNWICRTGKVQITSDIWWPFDLPVNLRFWNFLTQKNPLWK